MSNSNNTSMESDGAAGVECIHVSFHRQAGETPDATCLVEGDAQWTYAEVQERVLLLAKELRETSNAGRDAVVAIYMEPCADYVVSMLAILTVGAAYVPLELAYPTTMLQRVLHDALPVAVVTKLNHRAQLPVTTTATAVLCLDDAGHEKEKEGAVKKEDLASLVELYRSWPDVSLDDLAFVSYSSGTTGAPKGIANPHRAPAMSYRWRRDEISGYGPGDRVACNVFFVWEAVRPLMNGAAVVVVPASVVFDGDELSKMLHKQQVTEMLFTPSLLENLFNTMSEADLRRRLASLRTVFLNGEVVTLALRARCLSLLPHVRFINLYSISECHEVGALDLNDVDLALSTKFCPIGKPCSVSPAYVLDEEEKPVAPGDAGELYIGGDMLAVGYLNLPELTTTRFVPDPFVGGGSRMYRTGDRARILENGQLEILGRCDFMVKIRGYSVVLGAVEAALMEVVALSSCVVVADGEEGEEKHLVAYLVRAGPDDSKGRLEKWSLDTRTGRCPEIHRAVDGVLPHYMVPSVFIEVETLPVSAVGAKLDRKALQAQSKDRRAIMRSLQFSAETHTAAQSGATALAGTASHRWQRIAKYLRVPPGSPFEDVLDAMATIWEVVLGREPGSLEQDSGFHENGGHSLSAARLVSLINKVFSARLSAFQLSQGTNVGKLSQLIVSSWDNIPSVIMKTAPESAETSSASTGEKDWSIVEPEDEEKVLQQVRDAAVVPEDVVPVKTTGPARGLVDSSMVLLTGATGFLGAHVLAEILRSYPSTTVMCLVRSPEKDVVEKNLQRYKLWEEPFRSRIVLQQGDLSQLKLGLDEEWDRVVSVVDAVVHCGAVVSLTASFAQLEAANVRGTMEVIRLACACAAGTPLVYVSSNGIFPREKGPDEVFLENDDVACLPRRLGVADGYGLSKWAAERLVVEAHKRGLPAMTVRFGNIGWQYATGIGNSLDYQGMMLNGSRRLSVRPRVDGWKFEVTPIDFAAKALLALAHRPTHLVDGAIFNCVQNGFVDAERVFEWAAEVDGFALPTVSFEEWANRVDDAATHCEHDAELVALRALVVGLPGGGSYLAQSAHLDCSKFDAALAQLEQPLSRLSPSEVSAYYKTFFSTNVQTPGSTAIQAIPVDPSVSSPPVGPLAGKVAVVTGASSGIGRAIVVALVKAGCHVAMGARRISQLEETQKEVAAACPGSGAKTVIVRTDVTKRAEVTGLIRGAELSLGPVDILVNCAGVMYFTMMKNVLFDQWETQVDVNCKGVMYSIGSVLPSMLARGSGHIVNITSDAGRKAFAGLAVYSGSKFFVEGMSQALRTETASTGVRVTCIQPGNVETPLLSLSTDPEGLKEYGTPSGAKVLEPADIGRAVVYAATQPEWCAVNEILVEPREEPA